MHCHGILGRYMGLWRDPKFLQALDAVRSAWAPETVPELRVFGEGCLARGADGAPVVGVPVVAVADVARGRSVQRGALLESPWGLGGRGVASLLVGAAAPVGLAPSSATRQAATSTAARLVAQLQVQVETGSQGVYVIMIYSSPAANGTDRDVGSYWDAVLLPDPRKVPHPVSHRILF